MPYYNIRHKKTGKIVEKYMTISEMEEWEKSNPSYEVMCGAPGIGDGWRLGMSVKPNTDFRSRMKHVKKTYKGSKFNIV